MKTRSLYALVLAAIVVGTGARVPAAQALKPEQMPPFRVGTEAIELDVTVLGEDGRPVRGLTAADFTVLENGVPQPIVAFAPVDIPAWTGSEPGWMRDVAPDVVTNRPDARRAIVVIFDDFGIRWDPGIVRTARAIATKTIDQLGPADLAAVVYTLERRKGQEFTIDRERLRAAIDRFVPSGLAPQPHRRFDASAPGRA
jgi:VWFA-related protein